MDYGMTQPTPPPAKRESSTPNPIPTPKTESPRPTAGAVPAPTTGGAPSAPSAQRVLRPLRAWTEAVDRVKATSHMAASFLVSAKAYTTEDGRVVVKLDSDFARGMVAREGAPEALRAALSVLLNRKLAASDILYEVEEEKKRDSALIDLIIEAAEE